MVSQGGEGERSEPERPCETTAEGGTKNESTSCGKPLHKLPFMLRTIWAKVEGRRRLYVIDEQCDFVEPVKLYLDHMAALEKSPHTLENYCRISAASLLSSAVKLSIGEASALMTLFISSNIYAVSIQRPGD